MLLLMPMSLVAQRSIKWKGLHLNNLDKQGRKQGEWLFFDKQGNVLMECSFQNDEVSGPRVFFNKGDTSLIRFQPKDSLEHFIYYYKGQPLNGVFVSSTNKFRIELEKIPEGFNNADIAELKRQYAIKIEPVYMFATQALVEYFSAAYYKSNTIPNWNHNFVITINASGKVTNVEWEKKDELWSANIEHEVFEMFYGMGRWQPFFDTWQTKEIKITMSLGADLEAITAR
ncbi:hypothetical protein [Flavihumibacter fluvii]|uniref:hypothetical protein n=1 Tax=Flavihumibacter fluvii TaxID=2838157 RepID=UPI001BDE44CD|nr:hypothetical protein [Flavihumibacter fluvii]ULQ52525.1 hypothetical protein KJS93_20765 [Flavihumibacter fluvii]